MKYYCVVANNNDKLSEMVTLLINEGWKPHGGAAISQSPPYPTL
jgi:hypothetical protein